MNNSIVHTDGSSALMPAPIANTLDNWIDIHFGSHIFNGRVFIGSRKKDHTEIYQVAAEDINVLRSSVAEMRFYEQDYYITANTMSGVDRRLEGLFSLNNIVIDVDCHDPEFIPEDILQEFEFRFYRDLVDIGTLPEPNSIVRTGRGLQLWWAIEPISVKCKAYYRTIVSSYINSIRDMMSEYPDLLEGLQIDFGASNNMVGWFRLPGSFNTAISSYGALEINHRKAYSTHELYSKLPKTDLKLAVPRNSEGQAEIYDIQNLYTLGNERIRQLKKLQKLRADELTGSRDLIMFIAYNALVCGGSSDTEALNVLIAMNKNFTWPLSERALRQLTTSARRKGGYPLSNAWIIETLALSRDEQRALGIYEREEPWVPIKERTPNFTRDLKRQLKKEKRNEDILRLARHGKTDKEIAERVGCSINTVRSITKGAVNKKNDRQRRILELKNEGKTQKEVAELMRISLATVKRQWNM